MKNYLFRAYACAIIPLWLGVTSTPISAEELKVVASIHPLALVAQDVVSDSIKIDSIIPIGSEPHFFELTPKDEKRLTMADVVILNGFNLEPWAKGLRRDGQKIFSLEDFAASSPAHEHAWLNPRLISDHIMDLASFFCTQRNQDCKSFSERAQLIQKSLQQFMSQSTEESSRLFNNRFVSVHPAWGEFADAVGLRMVGVLRDTESKFIGTKDFALLSDIIKKDGVTTIVVDPSTPRDFIDTVVRDLHLDVVVLDEMGADAKSSVEFYNGLFQKLLTSLKSHQREGDGMIRNISENLN